MDNTAAGRRQLEAGDGRCGEESSYSCALVSNYITSPCADYVEHTMKNKRSRTQEPGIQTEN